MDMTEAVAFFSASCSLPERSTVDAVEQVDAEDEKSISFSYASIQSCTFSVLARIVSSSRATLLVLTSSFSLSFCKENYASNTSFSDTV